MFHSKHSLFPLQWQAVLWKVSACLFFAANNGIVKYLSKNSTLGPALSSYQLVFLQNLFGFLIMLPFIAPYGLKSLKTDQPWLHFYRVLTAVLGVILWYISLSCMTMVEAVALSFTGPIFTIIGARWYLQENITKSRFIAIGIGVIGAFIITRPDKAFLNNLSGFSWTWLFPLGSAIAIAMAKLYGRELGIKGESAENITFYLLFFMTPLSFIPAIFCWTSPSFFQWLWILFLGLLSAGAHYTTSHAYKIGEVTFLAPFGSTRLIFSGLIGFIFFQECPHSLMIWLGAIIIIFSTIYLAFADKIKNHPTIIKILDH